ncbi:MAG TPA: 30S ribosomal protein S6 [Pirellulaceae bacterium]|nr:30S ribosomal protein S6 [Pirellulaceae bacterium]
MALNVYENMVILDSNKYAQDQNGLAATVQNLVTQLGGEILVSRLWNEQKLAYPIKGHRKGTYWLTYMRLDSSKLTEFNRELRINEAVVRTLTLLVEPRLVDALVEHAKTGGRAKPVEAAPAAEPIETEVDEPVGAGVE